MSYMIIPLFYNYFSIQLKLNVIHDYSIVSEVLFYSVKLNVIHDYSIVLEVLFHSVKTQCHT